MRILLIEDEKPAADRLRKLVQAELKEATIMDVLDSVEDSVAWFRNFPAPDLCFADIQLADGLSFEIFEQVQVSSPLIFTTAFDQYAIKAFKLNSIDYLLKPIDETELANALEKFRSLYQGADQSANLAEMMRQFQQLSAGEELHRFKSRFLVKLGSQFHHIPVEEIAYFVSEDGMTCLLTKEGAKFLLDDKLDTVEGLVDPAHYYRINRKFIVSIEAIGKIHSFSNSRLKVDLQPLSDSEAIVARERVASFKKWLDS